jgi:predicted Zn-dependent protease
MVGMGSIRSTVVVLLSVCSWMAVAQSGGESAAERYAQAGQQALAADNYAEAQANFEQLAKLQPAVAEIHATLAVIYYQQRQYEAAVKEIHTAQKLKPGLPKLDSLLGNSLAELGRFKDALPGLEKGFRQSVDTEVRRMCGLQLLRAYTGLGRDSDAVTTALALNKFYPDDPEVLYHTGRIYGNIAYVVMEKLHDNAPDSIWMLQAQGEANETQKEYGLAIQGYEHILKLDPRRPGIHYRIGRVYLRRFQDSQDEKDRTAAQEQFKAELEVDPRHGNAQYELAQIDYSEGRLEQARKEFDGLVTMRPDFEQARVGLAGVLLESKEPQLALAQLNRAVEIDPDDEVAWYRLTRALRQTGDTGGRQKAMAEFQRLRSIKSRRAAKTGVLSEEREVTPQQEDPTAQP